MPRTGIEAKGPLSIKLAKWKVYHPGDDVEGTISVKPNCKESFNCITVKLYGRSKSKIKQKVKYAGTMIYRGRAMFFEVSQVIECKSQDVTSEVQMEWPFKIQIPDGICKNMRSIGKESDKWRVGPGYLSTEEDFGPCKPPSVFYHKFTTPLGSLKCEGYVEYWLEATCSTHKAKYPLFLRQLSTEQPIATVRGITTTHLRETNSWNLQLSNPEKKMPFHKKIGRSLSFSSKPRYSWLLRLHVPEESQIDHPDPLPLKLWVTPDLDSTRTTISKDNLSELPVVKVTNLEIKLKGTCEIRAATWPWDTKSSKSFTYYFHRAPFVLPQVVPMVLNQDLSNESMDKVRRETSTLWRETPPSEALDLGKLMNWRVTLQKAKSDNPKTKNPVKLMHPTFSTYNIRVSYILIVTVKLECAGQTDSVRYEKPIRVLAASEEQMREREEGLGTDGMKKNYDDLERALELGESGLELISNILQAI